MKGIIAILLLTMVCMCAPLSVMGQGDAVGYGLVNVAAACLRARPAHSAELETQATYGTPLRVYCRDGEWVRVGLPDGYEAWLNQSSMVETDSAAMACWRKSRRLIVTSPAPVYAYGDTVPVYARPVITDLVLGSVVEGHIDSGSRWVSVELPDGRCGYVRPWEVADFSEWAKRPADARLMLYVARSMIGVTYLWGGTTVKALDCSGLTRVCYLAAGLLLPRNASQQARCGMELPVGRPENFRAGDLLFFGNGDGERITHVGIYDSDMRFVHSSGCVMLSSLDAADELYLPRRVLKAVRILGVPDSPGVIPLCRHPWYF